MSPTSFSSGALPTIIRSDQGDASKPDYIDLGGTLGRDQPLVVKALREIGFKGVIAVGYADPGSLVELAGATAEGTVLINSVTEPQTPNRRKSTTGMPRNTAPLFPGWCMMPGTRCLCSSRP